MVDAVLFEQVLFNLLDNAAKYAPPGTTIRIESWREQDSVSVCRCWTKATAFPQPTSSASSTSSIARRRAIRCAPAPGWASRSRAASSRPCTARITAANRTDRSGAVFTITLPVPESADARGSSRMSAAPLKILVVDDEPPIRKLLRMGLGVAGLRGARGAERQGPRSSCSPRSPHLVILDLGLPDIDGLELLRRIRQRQEDLPIVVLSSRGDEAGKVAALDLGADDYVTKPFGMDELLARMRAALRHQLQVHGERPIFQVGDLTVDLVRRIVKVGDKEVKLSPKEYDLLRLLVQHAGKVLTHKFLLQRAVGRADRHAVPARLRAAAAAEDRDRPRAPAVPPDRDRHRLSPARAGVRNLQGAAVD